MLTRHVKLCAQRGIDCTRRTQIEAYAELVELLESEVRQLERELSAAKAETAAAVRWCEKLATSRYGDMSRSSASSAIRAAFPEYFKEKSNDSK